ncbi:MAG: AbrB/MazE/SpoVT family DNA-binding domain-containing protein [Candidatus Gracilibacteria bacterium]|nr:AbrB/MazE/SpoVT family DNA-binding domain-containing protein [Candidatus Gracilibacteria bacterium]
MKKENCKIKLFGTTTIGPKGQLVIPKEIRDKLNINTGDSMTIILKDDKFIGILKNEDITELLEFVKNEGIKLES